MSIKHLFYAIAASGILLGAASCSDNEPGTVADSVDFTLKLNLPISLTDPQLSSVDVAFTRVATGDVVRVTEFASAGSGAYAVGATLEEGAYNIAVSGKISYTVDGKTADRDIEASREGVDVSAASNTLTVETTVAALKSDEIVNEEGGGRGEDPRVDALLRRPVYEDHQQLRQDALRRRAGDFQVGLHDGG